MLLLEREKEDEDGLSKVVMVVASNGEDESSCFLRKMAVVVFKSCFQRPKDVIFKGLVRRFGYDVHGERK